MKNTTLDIYQVLVHDKIKMTMSIEIRGERIADLRSRNNFSQAGLAREVSTKFGIELTQGAVSHIETGRKQPSVEVLIALARLLNTSVDFLVGLRDDDVPPGGWEDEVAFPVRDKEVKAIATELVSILNQASSEDMSFYLDVIRKMSGKPPRIIGGE